MEKYIYQTAINQNSNLKMGKEEENENIGDQWLMTGELLFIIITVPINILEFQFSNLKQVKAPVKWLHTYDIKWIWYRS